MLLMGHAGITIEPSDTVGFLASAVSQGLIASVTIPGVAFQDRSIDLGASLPPDPRHLLGAGRFPAAALPGSNVLVIVSE